MVKTAFVFPGQGSQSIGMLSDFMPQYTVITDVFAEASDALGYDLWDLVQNGPETKLNQTEYTQAAMLTADVAIYRLLIQLGVPQPQVMAGHSLGEYAALVCANSLSLKEAARLVARRGQVMQNAIPLGEGAMAAIVGLSDEQVRSLCEQASTANHLVTPANYNALGQIVVAGHRTAVDKLIQLAEDAGARLAMIIPVSVPCHCPLLKDAAELFAENLAQVKFQVPSVDVVSNVDLSIYHSTQHIRDKLKEQLYSPVRWVETVQLIQQRGIELVVECGPGKVLNGLIKRIERNLTTISVYDTISLDQVIERLHIPV
ncbi:ACP S-malonyltransferase [Legionella pneumophila]|uniref:Malonyl CoA-acyl carrier protein transacylase n=1 Tax=Legionella pneumophila subsp. pascullei TaxID=91890 RepID=A0AAX2IWD4_LEGPN|nr:ACP S-malonyltransferase [Legionella pneumophila]AMP89957.1 malonyl CoA-acyl carrier protein transacylase [Legionella pneumophila subsp. pascullei]AMP92376.1 malonyl CoA-ACP transacylase [Legionella pneumophila subsp. pascullei]AMP95342.1 malonyl CoA-ACP transacylase [Legionella pneumophila subsp. pascullei]SQG90238.1 (acyl-carrier-protein) S-malonyltransferase [Legionella pneumophila subsp. pascullei]VEH06312.1 (acyl-carrier-protein) S-malonyltransferase [Legionella pneumophila subsp. pasc